MGHHTAVHQADVRSKVYAVLTKLQFHLGIGKDIALITHQQHRTVICRAVFRPLSRGIFLHRHGIQGHALDRKSVV